MVSPPLGLGLDERSKFSGDRRGHCIHGVPRVECTASLADSTSCTLCPPPPPPRSDQALRDEILGSPNAAGSAAADTA